MKLEFPDELPITPRMGDIVKLMREHRVLIVAGETGSGKTTQLPKACLAAGWGRRGMIAHTQPRRLAARTVAARIAAEMCVEVGAEVGYAVRFSERTSPATVVKVMTDGLLLNDIQRDRQLRRYECVIVDEAHERSLNVDFLLGYLRRLLERRDDLKVVVTSATIDVEAFAKHFGGAPVVEVSGRGYPVETIYRPTDDVERGVVDALREIGSSRRRARDGPGGRGWLPSPGSRRSGRARFAHPAPRTMASLRWRAPASRRFGRLSASCRACVETAAGSVARPSVRPTVHDPVRRFPPPGPRGAGSPTSAVLSADSDFSPPVPPRFVFLRLAVPPSALFAPARSGRASGPGLSFIAAARAASPVETTRPPRFLGDPCPHAPLSDPGGTASARPASAPRWCLPLLSQRRLPQGGRFRGSITRPARLPVYASQPGSPPDHATLGSGWLANLGRSGLSPVGSHSKVSVMSSHALPPSPSFAWRKTSPSPTGPSDDDMLPVTTARDVLVFQSGEREIFETTQLLRREFEDRFEIMPLYARLPEREQQRVFQPGRRPRVVLATNVAETSITVPNIGYVIDPGFARISRYSYRAKLQQLPIEPISQASARQRAGRCGRIAPGVCYRLCSEDDFEARPLYTDPELTRTNLAAVVLTMRAFRLGDIESFPFIDPPNPRAVRDAIGLLHELQALEGDRLTELGRTMARLPVDPRLARMMVEGDRRGSLAEVLVIVSVLASQDPRLRPLDRRDAADRAHAAFADKTSDFLAYVNLWRWLEQTRQENTRSAFNRLLQKRFLSPSRIREWRSLHRQLLLGCRGLGMRVNDKPAKYATIHRALLTGSLSFVGVKSERAEHTGRGTKRRRDQYEGARGLRFGLFPGSALGRSRPKWVMAAEVSTTGRTYARCVAEVAPSWIERAALHLVKRSYTEPRWDPKRGEAMVREQVTFYGLVVVGQRPKRAVEVDREAARKIFVRAALVESDERLHAPFIDHNRGLIERLEELCAKGRRPGLMVLESKRLRFYLDRLPDDVCSIPAFNAFVRGAGDKKLAALHMTEADLVGDSTASADERDFPTLIRFGDTDIPLAYKFAPGEPDDGVSLRVDSRVLMQLDRNALDWLVPGFFEEKCLALGKMLPKSLRRKLAPLGENMRVVQERLRQSDVYRQGNLADALSDAVRACRGVEVPPDAWRLHDLPAHLGMNVQIRGTRQRVLDQDRDVDALRRRHQTFTERNLTADRRKSVEVRGMTEFPNTGLPESLVVEDGVQRSVLYPVLVDRGNSVDLLVRATAEGRSALNRDAYTRLAMLAEPRSARELRREVEHDGTMMIHFAPLGSPAALVDDMVAAAFWFACFDGSALPRSKAEFDACARIGAGALRGTFSEILEQARQVLTRRTEVANSLDGLASPAFARSREDMARQLRNLVPPDFLRTTPRAQLAEVPRYLDGIAYRIGNLHGRVQRDLAGIERVAVWERRFAEVADQTEDPSSGMVTELRFLVEEFRIATFAQRIGTREKISDKRMAIRFDAAKSRSTSHERLARQRTLPC